MFELEYGSTGEQTDSVYAESPAPEGLSYWDRFKIAITPESRGEAYINAVYGPENNGRVNPDIDALYGVVNGVPVDDDFSSPNVYVQAKGAVKDAVSSVSLALGKYIFLGVVVILIFLVAYGTGMYAIRKAVFK